MNRHDLVQYLDDLLLQPFEGSDASNNGLQVEGKQDVKRVVFGVDACLELFERAVEERGDFICVHHGLSWTDSLKYLTRLNARRVGVLFRNDLSLYAAHLPLDMHPVVGHNAVIASRLGIGDRRPFFAYHGVAIGWRGLLARQHSVQELTESVNSILNTTCRVTALGPRRIRSVGIVSGGAADAVESCAADGLDCLITGEMDHTHYHMAREYGVNVLAAGHYRSETPGMEALMECVAKRFQVTCTFVDIPTGM